MQLLRVDKATAMIALRAQRDAVFNRARLTSSSHSLRVRAAHSGELQLHSSMVCHTAGGRTTAEAQAPQGQLDDHTLQRQSGIRDAS